MKKSLFLGLFLFFSCVLWAKGEAPAVNEDAFLVQKEISTWETSQTHNSKPWVYSCQAVRVHKNWFITAAHCVYASCRDSKSCTVQITLAEAELKADVRIMHSTASPRVFIYSGFFPGQNKISGVDVALIYFEPESAHYLFANMETGESLEYDQFKKLLRFSPETKAQYQASGVRLISAATAPTAQLKPVLAAPLVTRGEVSYRLSFADNFFVDKLKHFISPDFGVRPGNSGGGVFTAEGDLIGIVSSGFFNRDALSFQDDEGKTVFTLKNASSFFFFTGFNGSTLGFIRNKVPSLRTISLVPFFADPSEQNFDTIIKQIEKTSISF